GIMALNGRIFPVLEQLDIYEKLLKVSIPSVRFDIYSGDMSKISLLKTKGETKGKKELGDILVGADGVYSGVRREMFKQMQKENLLPVSDSQDLKKGFICMVETTRPHIPRYYPGLDAEISSDHRQGHASFLYSRVPGTGKENRLECRFTTGDTGVVGRDQVWQCGVRHEANEAMIKDVRDFLIPFANPTSTMSMLINATPPENISVSYWSISCLRAGTMDELSLSAMPVTRSNNIT
ncbi:hypothetical protein BGZ96_004654, partial [Linnemannia gamsii]